MSEQKQDFLEKAKDLRNLKDLIEKQILVLIKEFQDETGLRVNEIEIQRESWYMSGSYHIPAVFEVKLDVRL